MSLDCRLAVTAIEELIVNLESVPSMPSRLAATSRVDTRCVERRTLKEMNMNMKKKCFAAVLFASAVACSSSAIAAIEYDQNVTPGVIFGSGNVNGAYTTYRGGGLELGLRAKLRHNSAGSAENTFNSNGAGTYIFDTGVAPTQASPTAKWSFEWSINTNFDGSASGRFLDDLTYELSMVSTNTASIAAFDPINGSNPGLGRVQWDHSIGTNTTTAATDSSIPNASDNASGYAALIDANNVAQNSWKPHWYTVAGSFDPTVAGTYTFTLKALSGSTEVGSTSINVLVPEPASLGLLGLAGLIVGRRRR
jgi:hypothetical protein